MIILWKNLALDKVMVLTRLEQMMMEDGIRIGESRGNKMGIEEANK